MTAYRTLKAFATEANDPDFEPGPQCDGEYVICPHCGEKHGDAWEWCKEYVRNFTCQDCGKEFQCWAEHEVTYYTEVKS